jgi:hypothetical protein
MWGGVQRSDLDRETARANLATAERNLRGLDPSHAPRRPGRGACPARGWGGGGRLCRGGWWGQRRDGVEGAGSRIGAGSDVPAPAQTCRSDVPVGAAAPTRLDACMRAYGSVRAHARAHICACMDLAQARAHTPSHARSGARPTKRPHKPMRMRAHACAGTDARRQGHVPSGTGQAGPLSIRVNPSQSESIRIDPNQSESIRVHPSHRLSV